MYWMILAAMAGAPDGLRPALAPHDAPAAYRAWAAESGRQGEELVCEPMWADQAQLCFRIHQKKTRRYVTTSDLDGWSVSADALREAVADESESFLSELEKKPVQGMDAHYWVLRDAEGWAAAALLHPAALAEAVGVQTLLVAAPTDEIVLAWVPGNPDVEKVMAVAVRELYEGQDGTSVSPVVFQWSKGSWLPFAEAKPNPEADE